MTDAIFIKSLVKEYPNVKALRGIDLAIKKGEFFALLGPNGAGKTTTINILTGLCNKSSGEVKLHGKDVVSNYREARSLIGLVPQEFNLDQFEFVYKLLYFNAGYFGVPRIKRKKRITKLLHELGLWEKRKAKVKELSGGMKRKLMIARALLHEPRILILDEPTAGVDVETRKVIWEYMKKLNEKNVTILLTTHYIEEAEQLCERVAIINKGIIIALENKKDLLALFKSEQVYIKLQEKINEIPSSLKRYQAHLKDRTLRLSLTSKNTWNEVLADIQKAGIKIRKIETRENKLEDIFIHLTKKNGK